MAWEIVVILAPDAVGQLDPQVFSLLNPYRRKSRFHGLGFTRWGTTMDAVYPFSVFVGVDVSQDRLEIYLPSAKKSFSIEYNLSAIESFFASRIQEPSSTLVVMEGTGGYERLLLRQLQQMNLACAVVNPRQVREFARSCGELAKTDKLDARIISRFAAVVEPKVIVIRSQSHEPIGVRSEWHVVKT